MVIFILRYTRAAPGMRKDLKFRQLGRSKMPQFGRAVISRLGDRNSCLWADDRDAGGKAAVVRAV